MLKYEGIYLICLAKKVANLGTDRYFWGQVKLRILCLNLLLLLEVSKITFLSGTLASLITGILSEKSERVKLREQRWKSWFSKQL